MSYVTVDIDVDEVLWNMNSREKQQLADDLYEKGYKPKPIEKQEERSSPSIPESFYLEAIDKLSKNYHQLTSEEEQQIINLAKRF